MTAAARRYGDDEAAPNLGSYSTVIVAFSGGKDSLACLLHLLESGVPRERIELWHHDIDGREGSKLMDWRCTRDYCRAVAAAFGVPIYYSWKEGGFEREMLREGTATAPMRYEVPGGTVATSGGEGPAGTRLKFPQVSADLTVRWCSAYLKIDVCAAAIRNQSRFWHARTLVVSGERAEESAARSKYARFEPDRSDLRDGKKTPRHVDRWRPVHGWSERDVWAIIERWRVNPHPAYRLGFGRVSCMNCIFESPDQAASVAVIDPESAAKVADYEARFGVTIKRSKSLPQLAAAGRPYPTMTPADIAAARSDTFAEPVFLDIWTLPAGAFGESCGPT